MGKTHNKRPAGPKPASATGTLPAKPNQIAAAWSGAAVALAGWCWKWLVNRTDAFGQYLPLNQRTEKQNAATKSQQLDKEHLIRHFQGADVGHLIGLHVISADDTCKWISVDIDHHDELDPERHAANEKAAIELCKQIVQMDFRPLLIDSNGRGGYHIFVIFNAPVPASVAYQFAKSLIVGWEALGLTEEPETFPKQPALNPAKPLGNWQRLPGRHHTLPFYSQVWDGKKWLKGAEAIEYILAVEGDDPKLIPEHLKTAATVDRTLQSSVDLSSLPSHAQSFLKKLAGLRKSGDGAYLACCPAHADSNPSLSVKVESNGNLLVHCHAGCLTEQIVAAVDMSMRDLFPTESPAATAHTEAPPEKIRPSKNLARIVAASQKRLTHDLLAELAGQLVVSAASLVALGVGWSVKRQAWTFPERDDRERVIGILLRNRNQKKIVMKDSQRGLYLPQGWRERTGSLLIPEGASDTAALWDAGFAVVGRPSCSGGVQYLTDLLMWDEREIIVVGENDKKPDGKWPGRIGARRVAGKLSELLGREIAWGLPPDGFKDVRNFMNDRRSR